MTLIAAVAIIVALASCDNVTDSGGGITTVSVWARGTWYTAASGADRIKTVEITSTQYIAYRSSVDGTNMVTSEFMRFDCTNVTEDTVEFGGGLLVKKLESSDRISIGNASGIWFTVYK